MAENFKDILSNLSTEIDQETLLLYLQGKLPEAKKHEVEKHLLANEFADEAMEGLKEIRDKEQIAYMVEMLNRDLRKRTEKKKSRREKLKLKNQSWLYLSVLIFLILIAICYVVIQRFLRN